MRNNNCVLIGKINEIHILINEKSNRNQTVESRIALLPFQTSAYFILAFKESSVKISS